ncbi:hypothetical protein GCM10012286_63240 [Streptomyces lasiicapitis]|uniref:Uncharacterized protein n=1 Tax=Streptomyces lasiicapitis TaxID=1923961 RepID=A0ABQ2MLY0_9ACTN|nr:hypothetical protein GCM10012286_63240 [Streptomyces lasiicapitis]
MNATSDLDDQITKLYAAYTEHLRRCPESHVRADCLEGMRLRKAWTAAQWASLKASDAQTQSRRSERAQRRRIPPRVRCARRSFSPVKASPSAAPTPGTHTPAPPATTSRATP